MIRSAPSITAAHGDAARALKEAGAAPNQRHRLGATALLRSIDALEMLVGETKAAPADVRARLREITKVLLAAGADRSLGDDR